MKVCTRCKKNKELNKFSKLKASKDGLSSECKECSLNRYNTYRRTKVGLIKTIYRTQLRSSKRRGHPVPTYTKEEFVEAIMGMELFHKLHANWVASGYDKDLIPSIDRDDSFLPYTEDNITLMTWKENFDKYHKDLYEGNDTQCKPVVQLTLDGKFIKEFKSVRIAARELNLLPGSISNVCIGKCSQAGGYKFCHSVTSCTSYISILNV